MPDARFTAGKPRRWLVRFAVVLLLGLILLAAVLAGRYQEFRISRLQVPEAGLVYHLREGTSLSRLAHDLKRQGIIRYPMFFVLLGRTMNVAHRLQAGEYNLTPDLTPTALLEIFTSGTVIQHALAIIEGQTFREVLQTVRGSQALQHTLGTDDPDVIMTRLGHAGEHPEGRFLPDTYYFPAGMTDVAFLRRAYKAMEKWLAKAWEQRADDLPLKTPYEALILASIVEKETAVVAERPLIAGVFVQRLRKGMRLQTDPTVIYGMGETFDGNIRSGDLHTDTPYNTYIRTGLPPTPIAMPGRQAIAAVLHPQEDGYLYFVARGDGSHYFSRSLEVHNQAVKKYQLGQAQIKLPDMTQPQ